MIVITFPDSSQDLRLAVSRDEYNAYAAAREEALGDQLPSFEDMLVLLREIVGQGGLLDPTAREGLPERLRIAEADLVRKKYTTESVSLVSASGGYVATISGAFVQGSPLVHINGIKQDGNYTEQPPGSIFFPTGNVHPGDTITIDYIKKY